MQSQSATADFTVRPSWTGTLVLGYAIAATATTALLIAGLNQLSTEGGDRLVGLAVSALAAGCLIYLLLGAASLTFGKLTATHGSLVRRQWYGGSRVYAPRVITKIALRTVDWGYGSESGRAVMQPVIFFLNGHGRVVFKLSGYGWWRADFERLASALHARSDGGWERVAGPAQLRREMPGAYSLVRAYPATTGLVLGPVFLLAVGLWLIITGGGSG